MIVLTPEEGGAMRSNNKILAIRLVRERTGLGLVEAKKYVEAWNGKLTSDLPDCPHCKGTGKSSL